jgi:glycosyltransferase involved in cell wall biosynthesis
VNSTTPPVTGSAPRKGALTARLKQEFQNSPPGPGKTFAFVTLELYPTTVGGTGILLHHTITAMLSAGMRVILYLDLTEDEIERFERRDRHSYPNPHLLHFYDVAAIRRSLRFCEDTYDDKEQLRSVSIAHAILLTQGEHSIDLIEFYDYCGPAYHYLSFSRSLRRPVAIRLHNTTEIIERGTRSPFHKRRLNTFAMERAQLILADLVLSPGKGYFEKEVLGLYATEMKRQVVAMAAPIHKPIGEIEYSENSHRVLFYGRLSTFKGLDTFINGAVIALGNPEFRSWVSEFVIAGPEETVASSLTLEEIKGVIPEELISKFRFTGRLSHGELLLHLKNVSFACFANRMESFCYAAHELFTAGIPLILSTKPAFRDHFALDDVVFFDGAARELASAMVSLAADPAKRLNLSARAKVKPAHNNVAKYLDFATLASRRHRPTDVADRDVGGDEALTVFILSNGDKAAERSTEESLSGTSGAVWVLRLADDGDVTFSGSRWRLPDATAVFAPVGRSCMFIRAGDICQPDVLLSAADHLRENPQIGAIACWTELGGRVRSGPHAFIPEYAAVLGPGLRTLIRVELGLTVIELLRSASRLDEMSLLLEQRAKCRAIVEHPAIGVRVDNAVDLPPPVADAGVDYDRMSSGYLALSRDLILPSDVGARERQNEVPESENRLSLLSIRATDVFGAGEIWVLRVFRQRGAVHEPWSAVQQSGEWSLIKEPHSPAGGALKSYSGEISFWADCDFGIELLWGPFCGGAEVRFRGRLYRIKLKADRVVSSTLWVGDLTRGVAQPPAPDRMPIAPVGTVAIPEKAKSWIVANAGPSMRTLIVSSAPKDSHRAASAKVVVVTPAEVLDSERYTPADLALVLLSAVEVTSRSTVHLPFGLRHAPQVADLILRGGAAAVAIDIFGATISPYDQAVYRRLSEWIGIVDRCGKAISVVGDNDDLLFSFQAAGARVVRSEPRLVPCPQKPVVNKSAVDLIILRSDGLIDNVAHMVAGSAFLTMLGVEVSTMYVEEGQWHAASVCESLAAARACVSYRSLESVVALPRDRRLIACAVYPDPVIPAQAMTALSLGTPVLLGPVGRSDRYVEAFREMSVAYWEDAQDIGNALAKLAFDERTILDAYNKVAGQSM